MPPLTATSRSAPHLSLSLSSDADYPLLLLPASASLSPGFPPQVPVSPAYQTRSPSPILSQEFLTSPSDSAAMASRPQTRTAHVPPGTSAVAATPRTFDLAVPAHPIPSMQAAFAESLYEATPNSSTRAAAVAKPSLRASDAKARHNMLVDEPAAAPPPGRLWRYRPGQLQHELWKLTAQISFGMHLLLRGVANNNAQVIQILQGHIDEVDEFLEVALEDMAQASRDIADRIEFLRVPMENMAVFEQLLEDRQFRSQIADGNEKIEHVLARTRVYMQQLDDDIAHGVRATREFAAHLAWERDGQWTNDRADVIPIYDAMRGNADGWINAFGELAAKMTQLDDLATRLTGIVALMASKAGEVSRKTWSAVPPFSVPPPPRPSSSSSESTVSAGSVVTRITGFPAPPRIHSPTSRRKNSRSSFAVFPRNEVKFFDDNPGDETEYKSAASSPRVPSQSQRWTGIKGRSHVATRHGGNIEKQSTEEAHDGHDEDDGSDRSDDGHLEEAEVMEAVAAKIPRLTLNLGTSLDLGLGLGFRMSEFGLEKKLDLQSLKDAKSIENGGGAVSDSGEEMEMETEIGKEKETRDGGNNEIGIHGEVEAYAPNAGPDNASESEGDLDERWREAWRREPPNDSSRSRLGDDNKAMLVATDEAGKGIRTSILEPPADRFILQPRTYTPKLPAPLPSPMVRTPVIPPAEPDITFDLPSPPLTLDFPAPPSTLPKRSSLRQRVSQKTKPPEAIHIPPPRISYQPPPGDPPQPPGTAYSAGCLSTLPASAHRPESSAFRDSTHVRDSTFEDEAASVPDSADVSDVDRRRSFSQSRAQRPAMQSPFSDQVFSRNDLMSPPFTHLRPHSADAHRREGHEKNQQQGRAQTSHRFLQYPRHVSSRAGAASLLSNATAMTYNPALASPGMSVRGDVGMRSASATGTAAGGERKLKKKKSAFGWLKKAFTMDDEERAAFEARRMRRADDFYGEARSPRYIDGKRMQ